jgi:hypothetical protein
MRAREKERAAKGFRDKEKTYADRGKLKWNENKYVRKY